MSSYNIGPRLSNHLENASVILFIHSTKYTNLISISSPIVENKEVEKSCNLIITTQGRVDDLTIVTWFWYAPLNPSSGQYDVN